MKFSTEYIYKNLPSKHDFRENRLSENNTLLKDINIFLPF